MSTTSALFRGDPQVPPDPAVPSAGENIYTRIKPFSLYKSVFLPPSLLLYPPQLLSFHPRSLFDPFTVETLGRDHNASSICYRTIQIG